MVQLESRVAKPEQDPTPEQPNGICRNAATSLGGYHPVADAHSMFIGAQADRAQEAVIGRVCDRQRAVGPLRPPVFRLRDPRNTETDDRELMANRQVQALLSE